MLVGAGDHQHVVARHPHVPAEDVGGHAETGHVADVARAAGVRPGDGADRPHRSTWTGDLAHPPIPRGLDATGFRPVLEARASASRLRRIGRRTPRGARRGQRRRARGCSSPKTGPAALRGEVGLRKARAPLRDRRVELRDRAADGAGHVPGVQRGSASACRRAPGRPAASSEPCSCQAWTGRRRDAERRIPHSSATCGGAAAQSTPSPRIMATNCRGDWHRWSAVPPDPSPRLRVLDPRASRRTWSSTSPAWSHRPGTAPGPPHPTCRASWGRLLRPPGRADQVKSGARSGCA